MTVFVSSGIFTSGKYHSFKKLYRSTEKHIYFSEKAPKKKAFDTLITEDAKSGYEFYSGYFRDSNAVCLSSESNSAVFKRVILKCFLPIPGQLLLADKFFL